MNRETYRREISLAEGSFPTAADFGIVGKAIQFPKRVSGLTIVDIGSGLSNAVVELRKRGAVAYAIDFKSTLV